MTSWSNPVEDPEKHFLGNLLDDETSFSSSPQAPRGYNESTTIPTTSVINSVGPITGGNDGPSPFWPEPPPPYTPAKTATFPSPWGLSNCAQATENNVHFDGLLNSGLKEPSTWESLLNFSNNAGFQSNPGQHKPTEIHHHQHTHQHTHILQVRHNFDWVKPPQAFSNAVRKSTNSEIKRPQHLPPHSAPVVHKMPFSYRDVAARKEINPNGHSPSQANRKVTTPTDGESKLSNARSTESIAADFDGSRSGKEFKQKVESEFQKISRKKTSKEKRAMSDSSTPPQIKEVVPQPVVDVPTRYQVLENLHPASPKIVKMSSIDSDDIVFVPKAEKIEKLDEVNLSPPRTKKIIVTEIKKKATPTAPTKKRNCRKKTESDIWLFLVYTWNYLCFLFSYFQESAKWLMVLVVDVCTRSGELFLYGMQSAYESVMDFIKGIGQRVMNCFLSIFFTCRQMSLRQMFFTTQQDAMWGLDENMALPATTDEALERLLRVRRVDAYSILGLRADCTDEDITRHYSRLTHLLNAERIPMEGMEEAENLVETAYNLIRNSETRNIYNLNNFNNISQHSELLEMWDTLRMKIEESRHTMLCDCGKRHARIPTAIKTNEARYCKRCGTKHPARPNDLWVETRLLGFAWIYYTCADGVVYDITEWATCDTNYLKHMRPNAHVVQYRLVSPGTPLDKTSQALQEFLEEASWAASGSQKSCSRAQVSYRPMEPRDEDRSRRAANRRQKRR